jgi:Uma2 family endonuclease
MPSLSALDGIVCSKFSSNMGRFVEEHDLGYVVIATGCILNGKDTVYAPDVGFIAKARMVDDVPDTFFPFAPDLAVEVVSKNDSYEAVDAKVANYLRYGTRMVIVAYPKTERLLVYTPNGVTILEIHDTLDGGDVLPGFKVAVRDLFPRKRDADEEKG